MENITTNFIKYKIIKKNLKINLIKYKSKYFQSYKLTNILNKVYNTNKLNPIFIHNDSIFSLNAINDELGLLKNFETSDYFIDSNNYESIIICLKLIQEIIALNIKNDQNTYWKINIDKDATYEVSKKITDNSSEFVIYSGFKYKIFFIEENELLIVVNLFDSIFKPNSLKQNWNNQKNINKNQVYIDTCPIFTCIEKSNPFSECFLSGAGKFVKITNLINSKPSEITVAGHNLLEYYLDPKICPQTPLLHNNLKDTSPIAEVQFHLNDQKYFYPLERLHEPAKKNSQIFKLQSDQYKNVNPNLKDRNKLIESYCTIIHNILFKEKNLQNFIERDGLLFESNYFCNPEFIVGNEISTQNPAIQIENYGTYRGHFTKGSIYIQIIYFKTNSEYDIDIIRKFFDKSNNNLEFSFCNYTKLVTKVLRPILVKNIDEFKELYMSVNNENLLFVLVYESRYDLEDSNILEIYKEIIRLDVPKQGIYIENFLKYFNNYHLNYFRSLSLSINAKLGLSPWKIKSKSPQKVLILSIEKKVDFKNDVNTYACNFYMNDGNFLKGIYSKSSFEKDFPVIINTVRELLMDGGRLLVIKEEVFSRQEINLINNSIDLKDFMPILMRVITSPIHIFFNNNDEVSIAKFGLFIKINDNTIIMPNKLIFNKNRIYSSNIIQIINSTVDKSKDELQILYESFYYYSGRMSTFSDKSIPIQSCKKLLRQVNLLNIDSVQMKYPWFI